MTYSHSLKIHTVMYGLVQSQSRITGSAAWTQQNTRCIGLEKLKVSHRVMSCRLPLGKTVFIIFGSASVLAASPVTVPVASQFSLLLKAHLKVGFALSTVIVRAGSGYQAGKVESRESMIRKRPSP